MEILYQCLFGSSRDRGTSSSRYLVKSLLRCWLPLLIGFQNVKQQQVLARFLQRKAFCSCVRTKSAGSPSSMTGTADEEASASLGAEMQEVAAPSGKKDFTEDMETCDAIIAALAERGEDYNLENYEPIQVHVMNPGTKKTTTYTLQTHLGSGNYGSVFHAKSENGECAIKFSTPGDPNNSQINERDRLLEIQKTGAQPANVVRMFDHGNMTFVVNEGAPKKAESSPPCLVLEYYKDGDLYDKIGKKLENGEDWTRGELSEKKHQAERQVVKQVLTAVNGVHERKTAHLDIKWDNFLSNDVVPDGTPTNEDPLNWILCLADFGFAQEVPKTGRNRPLMGDGGNPRFQAPEVMSKMWYSEKADMWSVGIMIFQLLYTSGNTDMIEPFMFGVAGIGFDFDGYGNPHQASNVIADVQASRAAYTFLQTLDVDNFNYTIDSLLEKRLSQLAETDPKTEFLRSFRNEMKNTTNVEEDPQAPLKHLLKNLLCCEDKRWSAAKALAYLSRVGKTITPGGYTLIDVEGDDPSEFKYVAKQHPLDDTKYFVTIRERAGKSTPAPNDAEKWVPSADGSEEYLITQQRAVCCSPLSWFTC